MVFGSGITTGASGSITIMGTTTGTSSSADGVLVDFSPLSTMGDTATVSITGSSMGGDGVEIAAGIALAINATNAAPITITGTGDGSESGVQIDSPISSETGPVTIRSEDGGSTTDDIQFGAAGDITSTSGTR